MYRERTREFLNGTVILELPASWKCIKDGNLETRFDLADKTSQLSTERSKNSLIVFNYKFTDYENKQIRFILLRSLLTNNDS